MASGLSIRALTRVQATKSGLPQAKKLADLYIKSHTNDAGDVTDPNVYQYVIDQYLAPFAGEVDADRAIAGYANKVKDLNSKQTNAEDTVAAFKRQELNAWFNDVDGDYGFRNPEVLAMNTSQALDNVLVQVLNAIDDRRANGQSIDSLVTYADTLSQRADSMRDLSNKLVSGQLPANSLDGYGYYVDTNPLDGSVRGAALIPANLAPDELTKGMKRTDAKATLGDSKVPVYLPATQDDFGDYHAQIGQNTFTGGGTGALSGDKLVDFTKDNFNIGDATKFPVKSTMLNPGEFGRIPLGAHDESGKPTDSIVYRGFDNKVYTLDNPDVLATVQADQFLGKKLNGYLTRLSPTEASAIKTEAQPLDPGVVARSSKILNLQDQAAKARAEYDAINNQGFFQKVGTGLAIEGEKVKKAVSGFFSNRVNEPVAAPRESQSSGGQSIGAKVVEAGKGFFRKITGQ